MSKIDSNPKKRDLLLLFFIFNNSKMTKIPKKGGSRFHRPYFYFQGFEIYLNLSEKKQLPSEVFF